MLEQYRRASCRAVMLDYDGTLVAFAPEPRFAQPDKELLDLLASLGKDPRNEVAIVSGRPRGVLEDWLGNLPISFIAEHGAWTREKGGEWRVLRTMSGEWKERVLPLLQLHVDRLPGASIEEKEFSLAWHYRRADPDQAWLRSKELLDDLTGFTRNIDVQVFEGNKVIEVRNAGVNKGTAALEWLAARTPDFILAIGDDRTDEDLFKALPPAAYSVRVGVETTAARFYVGSVHAVRPLLQDLASSAVEKPA
jgi:trehalose 6-phosphate synthase/phosphatase